MSFLFNKKEEKNNPLNEIKKLTLGEKEKPTPKKQTTPEENYSIPKEIKADVDLFKEQQKRFNEMKARKGIIDEKDYYLPKENKKLTTANESTQVQNSSLNNKTHNQKQSDLTMNETESSKSAFEKLLMKNSEELKKNPTKETITQNNYSNPQVTNTIIETKINQDSGKIERTIVEPPKIQEKQTNDFNEEKETTIEEEQTQETEPQKDYFFSWMEQPKIEKPLAENFIEKETAFSKNKKIMSEKNEEKKFSNLHTPIDDVFTLLEKYEKIDTGELSKFTNLPEPTIEQIIKPFEEDGIVEIHYPTSLTKKPEVILKNPVVSKITQIPQGEVLENYNIEVDYVPAKISIILSHDEARPIYSLEVPSIGKYTLRFLSFIKDEVAETMPIELDEITDPKKSKKLKGRFFKELSNNLQKYFPNTPQDLRQMLSGVLLHEMYGLGDIELLMGDDNLEEVGINSAKTPITIYHKKYGWLKTNIMPGSEEEINNYSSQIGRKVGREITVLNPILDAHLLSGDRVNATLSPISSEGNTMTIRRFARKPWTIVDFIGKTHTMNSEMAATLWLAMQYEMNIIIAGGTASGKTSALNSMLALVPTYHRIISIEDVREIVLPTYLNWNWVPLVTRSANPEGLGEVTMLDLMVTSLRMRPDRIIVGEIRRKKEAEVLMEAIETGHSIYSTIHANSGYQVLRRLAEPPISIPLMQIELIDLIVVQYRDRKTNKRRTYEIAEVEQTSSGQGLQINTIYKWIPRTDDWDKLNKPNKLITLLNMHTGLTEDDINKEIIDRQKILEWMQRQEITELETIGFLMKIFYATPEKLKKMAQENISFEEVIEMMNPKTSEEKKAGE
ncbi:MAG: type II/IV secretion system ATPase subunit [Candidatus Iainarchaeum sp.]